MGKGALLSLSMHFVERELVNHFYAIRRLMI